MIRTRIPSYRIKLNRESTYTGVELYVKDQLVARTSLRRNIQGIDPEITQFIRQYFHLPTIEKPKKPKRTAASKSKFTWAPGDLKRNPPGDT